MDARYHPRYHLGGITRDSDRNQSENNAFLVAIGKRGYDDRG